MELKNQNICRMISEGRLEEGVRALSAEIDSTPVSAALLLERGKLLWRLGRRAAASSDYARAAAIDPSGPAAELLAHARDIENFYNPDIYNP